MLLSYNIYMNIKLFLFSNLISISKINCIDLKKIEVYVDKGKVETGEYIKLEYDDLNKESTVSLIGENVSISKIEVELQDDSTLFFINIS